jgi:hypothetical protein
MAGSQNATHGQIFVPQLQSLLLEGGNVFAQIVLYLLGAESSGRPEWLILDERSPDLVEKQGRSNKLIEFRVFHSTLTRNLQTEWMKLISPLHQEMDAPNDPSSIPVAALIGFFRVARHRVVCLQCFQDRGQGDQLKRISWPEYNAEKIKIKMHMVFAYSVDSEIEPWQSERYDFSLIN